MERSLLRHEGSYPRHMLGTVDDRNEVVCRDSRIQSAHEPSVLLVEGRCPNVEWEKAGLRLRCLRQVQVQARIGSGRARARW